MRQRLEYLAVLTILYTVRLLPRPLARGLAYSLAMLIYFAHGRLKRVGLRNLELAYPGETDAWREKTLKGVYISLGRLLAEIPKFSTYTREKVDCVAVLDGLENFKQAKAKGKGILFLTAHLGGWEVGPVVHALCGNPLYVVMRPLDNPHLDRLVRSIRTMHGNRVIDKDQFARGVLAALRQGETVGVLIDTNMTPPEGVFVDFFGIPASTTTSVARLALKTGAAVVPAFTIWDQKTHRYKVHFEPEIEPARTGDDAADAITNTAHYTAVIEQFIRKYPDQWLWVHRRWKTRPDGEAAIYKK